MKALPIIPGYELLSSLGGGTLTSVYAARDLSQDIPCVVKLLRPDWKDQPTAVKLLQREARACLAVQHPYLVQLLHAHVTRPPYFLVLEMLEGETLRRRLRRDYCLGVADTLWIARQLAQALEALHRAGFIHGDVKPDNIRLAGDGQARLLDLGFAHRPGENASLLEKGFVLGTVNYLAPELCLRPPGDVPASDLFSFGITLFEMLTGQLPYPAGNTHQTMRRHATEEPCDIRQLETELPNGLASLVMRLLEHEPAQRPRLAQVVQQLIALEIAALRRRRSA